MAESASYKRPPVPSAEESARAGWMAPLVAIALVVFVVKSSPDPTVKLIVGGICCLLYLFGLIASSWGFYVASFFGPRKHILPAIVGFAINALAIVAVIAAFQNAFQAKAEYEAAHRTPAVADQSAETPTRY